MKFFVVPLLLAVAPGVMAQNLLFDDVPVPANFPGPEGMALGSLHLDASADAGVMATNNVYRDASHLSSEASVVGLASTLTSSGDRHLLVGTLEHYAQDFRDSAFQDMDLDASTLTLFGRFVTSEITNVRLLLIDEEDILGKTQSEQLNSFTSGLQRNQRVEAIFEMDNTRYFANVMARNDQIDSDSFSETATGLQDDALDRSERDYILLAGRSFGWGRGFVFGGTQTVRYDSSSMPSLAERNSREKRYGLGAEYQVGKFSGDVDVYRFTQRFDSPAIPNVENEWVGSGNLSYASSEAVTLVFAVERKFHETNIPNSGGIIAEDIFAGAAFSLAPNLYVRIGPSYNRTDILNTPVVIDRYELDLELGWQFSQHLKLQFTANVFAQEAENPLLTQFRAQQASSLLSLGYSL